MGNVKGGISERFFLPLALFFVRDGYVGLFVSCGFSVEYIGVYIYM